MGNNEEDDEGFVFNDGMMPNEEDFRRLAEMDEPEDPNFDNVLVDDEIMAKLEDIAIMEARAKAFVFPEHLVAASRATSMPTPLLDPEEVCICLRSWSYTAHPQHSCPTAYMHTEP